MLSDESSSDSETGRFKGHTENKTDQTKHSDRKESFKSSRRERANDDKYSRDFRSHENARNSVRWPKEKYSRLSPKHRRHSPGSRYRYSRKSPDRSESRRYSRNRSKQREQRSTSKERSHVRSKSSKSSRDRRDLKDEIIKTVTSQKDIKRSKEISLSPDYRGSKSVIQKPVPQEPIRNKPSSPVIVDEVEVQAGSYYSMIPAVIKDKSDVEDSSEIDSSDDERLRAKLLNLEKKLEKTKKKKHKKKHKRKNSTSAKEKDLEGTVEVTSTTDIQSDCQVNLCSQPETFEVSSTQKNIPKETSEEGEICSDDSQDNSTIDPNDLRHKLKRSKVTTSICGPALPPHLETQYKNIEGPVLPPHLQRKRDIVLGPTIPDNMRNKLADQEIIIHESSDEDMDIGPLPIGAEDKWSDAHKRLEERALDMKLRKLDGHSINKTETKSREQWMLELPEGKAKYLGLEARSFRAKEGPDMSDRSSWTDTPADKAQKEVGIAKEDVRETLQRDARVRHIIKRDEDQEEAVKKHKKKHKRDESLLDIHQKKLKKKKKKFDKEEVKERRPFSRDIDLQVNRFDEAQKKSIIKKAQNLDTRFSRGEAKYL